MQYKCDALIVDLDLNSRMRLRQATTAVPQLSNIILANSFQEGLRRLEGDDNLDVVFVRDSVSASDLSDFLKKCKQSKQGKDSALILVLKGDKSSANSLALNYANGVDGFLSEPYSVDEIQRIAEVAEKMKEKKLLARKKAALKTVLEQAPRVVDLLALDKNLNIVSPQNQREASEIHQVIAELSSESLEDLGTALVEIFENIPAPQAATGHMAYKGASERVRRMIEEREKAASAEKDKAPDKTPPAAGPSRYIIRKR